MQVGKCTRTVAAVSVWAAAMALTASPAYANTVSSNDPDCVGPPTSRVFTATATTVMKCVAKGTGNINGSGDPINALGYTLLDKSDVGGNILEGTLSLTGGGSTAGTFTIAASVYSAYSDIVIAFKSGSGTIDPDWAGFLLADNTLTGSWTISSQGLSHANIYGKLRDGGGGGGGTPEPASLALLGLGLLGIGAARRRKA